MSWRAHAGLWKTCHSMASLVYHLIVSIISHDILHTAPAQLDPCHAAPRALSRVVFWFKAKVATCGMPGRAWQSQYGVVRGAFSSNLGCTEEHPLKLLACLVCTFPLSPFQTFFNHLSPGAELGKLQTAPDWQTASFSPPPPKASLVSNENLGSCSFGSSITACS